MALVRATETRFRPSLHVSPLHLSVALSCVVVDRYYTNMLDPNCFYAILDTVMTISNTFGNCTTTQCHYVALHLNTLSSQNYAIYQLMHSLVVLCCENSGFKFNSQDFMSFVHHNHLYYSCYSTRLPKEERRRWWKRIGILRFRVPTLNVLFIAKMVETD